MVTEKIQPDYGTLHRIVKQLRARGMSQRAIKNVLRFYGVDV